MSPQGNNRVFGAKSHFICTNCGLANHNKSTCNFCFGCNKQWKLINNGRTIKSCPTCYQNMGAPRPVRYNDTYVNILNSLQATNRVIWNASVEMEKVVTDDIQVLKNAFAKLPNSTWSEPKTPISMHTNFSGSNPGSSIGNRASAGSNTVTKSKKRYTPLQIPIMTVNGQPQKPTALPVIDGTTQSLAVNTGFSERIFENFSSLYIKDNNPANINSSTILDASIIYRSSDNKIAGKYIASCVCMMFSKKLHKKFAEHRWENVKKQMILALPIELNPNSVELVFAFMHGVPITLAPENFEENLEKLYITAKYLQVLPLLEKIQIAGKQFDLNYQEMESFIEELPQPCIRYSKPAALLALPKIGETRSDNDDVISIDSGDERPPTPTQAELVPDVEPRNEDTLRSRSKRSKSPQRRTRSPRRRSRSPRKRHSRSPRRRSKSPRRRSRSPRRRSRSRERSRRSRSRDRTRRSRSPRRRSRSRSRDRRDTRSPPKQTQPSGFVQTAPAPIQFGSQQFPSGGQFMPGQPGMIPFIPNMNLPQMNLPGMGMPPMQGQMGMPMYNQMPPVHFNQAPPPMSMNQSPAANTQPAMASGYASYKKHSDSEKKSISMSYEAFKNNYGT